MMRRVTSGHSKLDEVLGGGLPEHNITLIAGLPGSGKTIVAQQYVFANASPERPSVYLSTVSEPFDKILRYVEPLSFFDPSAIGHSVFYEDLGRDLNTGGLDVVLKRLEEIVKTRHPGILVIDSFKPLRTYAENDAQFRHFLHDLAGQLTAAPMTSIWVGEYSAEDTADAPEFAVADAMVLLASSSAAQRESRYLQVLKLRGSTFRSGQHAYRISADGIEVFPRLADPIESSAYALVSERISSGIQALDDMLDSGYWRGASTLVAGPSGSGKTLMGLHFLFNGARMGDPGILAMMQENPTQLARILGGFGWGLDEPNVHLMYRTPVDFYVDQWVYELLEMAERVEARRIVIDSLADILWSSPDEVRFREYIYSLLNRCSRLGVSVLMTYEVPEIFGASRLSQAGTSHLADNVVALQFVRAGTEVKRALTVLKTRASSHLEEVREFIISTGGIVLGDRVVLQPEAD